jgi:TM2 domain-containing membrane protein YozV
VPATAAEQTQSRSLVLLCLAAWAIPGAGHLWLGRRSKGLIFLVALPLMFAIGLAVHGRLFPFDLRLLYPNERWEPLAGLACLADLGIGAVYFAAGALGYGAGDVRAVTYEYGNAFLIVAGLLNLLVVIDAYDVAVGRK